MSLMPMPFPGPTTYPGHGGLDWPVRSGTPVPAIAEGIITYAGSWGRSSPKGPAGGLTKTITRADGLKIIMCHFESLSGPGVGARVSLGESVAPSGNTGNSTGPHLHMELWKNGVALNEWDYMDQNNWIGKPGGSAAPASGGGIAPYSKTVENEQSWLNHARGEKLFVDGRKGPATTAAYKRYQTFLRAFGYAGDIDGIWGGGTQAAHAKYYASVMARPATPSYPVVAVGILGQIGDVRGLQKIARLGGYKGGIDNAWGGGSQAGFQRWLNANYGGSVANWLRKRWGYVGNDQLGPVMLAALRQASAENFRAL